METNTHATQRAPAGGRRIKKSGSLFAAGQQSPSPRQRDGATSGEERGGSRSAGPHTRASSGAKCAGRRKKSTARTCDRCSKPSPARSDKPLLTMRVANRPIAKKRGNGATMSKPAQRVLTEVAHGRRITLAVDGSGWQRVSQGRTLEALARRARMFFLPSHYPRSVTPGQCSVDCGNCAVTG